MGNFWRLPNVVINLMLVFSLTAIWLAFAPTQAGGQASYVMVNGNSMEPGFHLGDLVIVRAAPSYDVGDVVTYRDTEMGVYVIHRVIGIEQDRYILKGDNNSWIDGYRPTRADIIGKLWIYVPKLGRAMQWLRLPINAALIIGLIGGILMASMMVQPNQPGKSKNKPSRNPAGVFEMALYTLGLLALAFLALSAFSFSRPLKRNADPIPYQQTGVFSYSAIGSPRVYDTGTARSGEPVFPKLTCTLNLGFVYNLAGEQLENVSGYQQLDAKVLDEQSGWQRTIPLTSATNFYGDSFTSLATLDLCQVEALVAAVEQETGFRSSSYTLAIIAHVLVAGKLSGQEFIATFESPLVFRFDSLHFYLAAGNSQTDPLQIIEPGSVSNPGSLENTLPLLGLKPTVRNMRIISATGLVFTLGGLLALGWFFYTASMHSQVSLIRMKYGSLMVDVYGRKPQTISPVIDVPTIDELAKIARRLNLMILYTSPRDRIHYYLVQNNGTAYRYVAKESHNSTV